MDNWEIPMVGVEHIWGSMPAAQEDADRARELWHAQMAELVKLRRFFNAVRELWETSSEGGFYTDVELLLMNWDGDDGEE